MKCHSPYRFLLAASSALLLLVTTAEATDSDYDPLQLPHSAELTVQDLTVEDAQRRREIPIRLYLPEEASGAPVILFSHGLGGSREGCAYLGEHWAARGYASVFLQHPGSDLSVWENVPPARRLQAMREAASGRNFLKRVGDVTAVLDQLESWNRMRGHLLSRRLDLERVGMAGHSFGARTTQAVGGQSFRRGGARFTDERIDAALILSPSSPSRGKPDDVFGSVSIPWMLMTGTNDIAPIGNADMDSRLAVFPALPPGDKFELVLFGAEHSAFTDRPLPGSDGSRNPRHHPAILALGTAFWDAYLMGDTAAKAWIRGEGPRSLLAKQDSWQRK
jgi:dienelactone hydrolase